MALILRNASFANVSRKKDVMSFKAQGTTCSSCVHGVN